MEMCLITENNSKRPEELGILRCKQSALCILSQNQGHEYRQFAQRF